MVSKFGHEFMRISKQSLNSTSHPLRSMDSKFGHPLAMSRTDMFDIIIFSLKSKCCNWGQPETRCEIPISVIRGQSCRSMLLRRGHWAILASPISDIRLHSVRHIVWSREQPFTRSLIPLFVMRLQPRKLITSNSQHPHDKSPIPSSVKSLHSLTFRLRSFGQPDDKLIKLSSVMSSQSLRSMDNSSGQCFDMDFILMSVIRTDLLRLTVCNLGDDLKSSAMPPSPKDRHPLR